MLFYCMIQGRDLRPIIGDDVIFFSEANNKTNIFLSLMENELNSALGASHLIDHILIQFDLERYLLITIWLSKDNISSFIRSEAL